MKKYKIIWSVGVAVKDSVHGAGGLGFDSGAGQNEHSAANGSPPLPHFFREALPRR